MKIVKRILMLVLSLSMAAAIVAPCSLAATVEPRSSTDSNQSVNIKNSVYTYGPRRIKDNTTCVYFWGRSCGDVHFRVRAGGYFTYSTSTPVNCTQLQSGDSATYVICRVGVKYMIYNNIREKGYEYASLGFARDNSPSSSTTFLNYTWSPDSVGNYTPAT